MFTVLVNDKKFCAEDGTPLKEILSLYSDDFCAEKKDKCLTCPHLKENAPDGRFLRGEEFFTCEKAVDRDLVITTDFKPEKENISFSVCSLVVNVGDKRADVCLTDGRNVVVRSMVNPLLSIGDLTTQETAYEREPTAVKSLLSTAIKNKCADLLAEFDQKRAQNAIVCASEFYLKILFGLSRNTVVKDYSLLSGNDRIDLPAEKVRVLPPIGPYVSGELFCASVTLPENTFLVDCESDLTLLYIGKETDTYTFMWGVDYSELSLLMIRAAMRVIRPEGTKPIVRLYGENAYFLEDMLTEEGLSYIHAEKDTAAIAKAITPSFYAKLEKEKKRTSYHDLLKDEVFQEEMNNIYLLRAECR